MAKLQTFYDLLQQSATKYGSTEAFRSRTRTGYTSISYNDLFEQSANLAAALQHRGIAGKHISILGENSYEWVVAYLATVLTGGVAVPLDKELTEEQISGLIKQSDSSGFFCSADYDEYAEYAASHNPEIEIFIMAKNSHKIHTTLNTLMQEGQKIRESDPKAGCLEIASESYNKMAAIVFTSGTTGMSKGVMLSRKNLLSNVESADRFIRLGQYTLSVLPMHHTYAFTLDILFGFYQGRTIAINNGIKNFAQNLKMFAPTDMLVVPLIAENLYNTIWQSAKNSGKDKILKTMIKASDLLRKVGIDLRSKLFGSVHQAFGGRLSGLFVGGAYLDPRIAHGFASLGIEVNIGYGISECSPLVSGNITHLDKYTNSCGVPIPDVAVRIDNPNDMGEGEILVSGPSVMLGYYKNPSATAEVLDDQGWFRTGDIGRMDSDGMIYITGRVKNLIVLKNGKNVYPEEIENELITDIPLIKEVVVSAQQNNAGEELNITAEIFPNTDLAQEQGINDYKDHIRKQVEVLNQKLAYYKRIVDIKFRDTEFAKTTTKKIKRY